MSQKALLNFCNLCNSLLNLPELNGASSCPHCRSECSFEDIVVETTFRSKKDFLTSSALTVPLAAKINDGSVVCPECSHQELYFKTAQLRAADEGQTVFYECTSCGFTWSVNT
eukprot:TRINITY_DN16195_c0_g1_i1.p1 TRINITY_DN16195_c0_g1~~TRINITY_DN16195_c0_g1_i1.p1  ORF type:complete len:113 (-),score=9.14 TRINITY_DN16195_c0_g1_i1:36-374(-)